MDRSDPAPDLTETSLAVRLYANRRGLKPEAAAWTLNHHSYLAERTDMERLAAFVETLIRASREHARWSVPWFTALATYHSETDSADDEFRAAQKVAWDKGIAMPGPDTDALRGELRAGVHFKAAGLQKHGALWVEKVAPWLEAQLSAERPR